MANTIQINNTTPSAASMDVAQFPPNAPLNFGSLTKLFVSLTPQSEEPSSANAKDVYLDDGTNTKSGLMGLRYYNGTAWQDIGLQELNELSGIGSISYEAGHYLRANGTEFISDVIQTGDLPLGIDVAKIANGDVSNAEFQCLDGVTDSIQTQLDGKAANGDNSDITSLSGLTTPLSIGQGGTGASSVAGVKANLGYMTDLVDDLTPQVSGNLDLRTYKIVGEGGSEGIYVDKDGNVGIDTNVLYVDATNNRIGINTIPGGGVSLDVIGKIRGTGYLNSASAWVTTQKGGRASLGNLGGTVSFVGATKVGADLELYANNEAKVSILSTGNVGIETSEPTKLLSLGGDQSRTFWMERCTADDSAGYNLTIAAGGATSGATDKVGGDLILKPGVSTGIAESGILLQGCIAGDSGTNDNSFATIVRVLGNKIGFYGVIPTVRQVLATGASHTVDDVITVLQNLGLVSQS